MQGRKQDFSKGASKKGVAKAISTARFVSACAWCAQAMCAQVRDAQGVSGNSGNPLGTPLECIEKLLCVLKVELIYLAEVLRASW